MKRLSLAVLLLAALVLSSASGRAQSSREDVLAAMKRATTFMTDKVAYKGGYVWSYLPDLSRRWGEMEARDTMIWIQPPGTPTLLRLQPEKYDRTLKCFSPY